MKVNRSRSTRRPRVTTDGEGLVSHAGSGSLAEAADRSGLTPAMSQAMADCGISLHTHDPGVVLTHVAVAITDGADCLSDMAVLREQDELFAPVASHATAWRAIEAVTSVELRGIARAMAEARGRVWAAGDGPGTLTLDFDATLVRSHSDKQDAAPTHKGGFGFHPLGVWLDETAEPLAAILRPGNAGANDAADHVQLLGEAAGALPVGYQAGHHHGDGPVRSATRCWCGPTLPGLPTTSSMPWWPTTPSSTSATPSTAGSATRCCCAKKRTGHQRSMLTGLPGPRPT